MIAPSPRVNFRDVFFIIDLRQSTESKFQNPLINFNAIRIVEIVMDSASTPLRGFLLNFHDIVAIRLSLVLSATEFDIH